MVKSRSKELAGDPARQPKVMSPEEFQRKKDRKVARRRNVPTTMEKIAATPITRTAIPPMGIIDEVNRYSDSAYPLTSKIRSAIDDSEAILRYLAKEYPTQEYDEESCITEAIRIRTLETWTEISRLINLTGLGPARARLRKVHKRYEIIQFSKRLDLAGREFMDIWDAYCIDQDDDEQIRDIPKEDIKLIIGNYPFICQISKKEVLTFIHTLGQIEKELPQFLPSPRRARGRRLIGPKIKKFIKKIQNDGEGITWLADETKIGRKTLYNWAGPSSSFVFENNIEKLIAPFENMEIDLSITGKIDISSASYIDPEKHDNIMAMLKLSPTLRKICKEGKDMKALFDMPDEKVKNIYIKDTLAPELEEIDKDREKLFHGLQQADNALDQGLIKLFMMRDLTYEGYSVEKVSYSFHTRPMGLDDKDAFAIRIDGEWFTPLYENGETVVVSPNTQIARGNKVLLRLLDDEGTEHLILGRYRVSKQASDGKTLDSAVYAEVDGYKQYFCFLGSDINVYGAPIEVKTKPVHSMIEENFNEEFNVIDKLGDFRIQISGKFETDEPDYKLISISRILA